MNKLPRVVLFATALLTPVLAFAQVTGSSTIDVQIQSLLSEISSLEQQLHTLMQSVAPTSTSPTWWNASSTPPTLKPGQGLNSGSCPNISNNLSEGSQGSGVTQLQQFLQGQGFFSASTTGFFGPLTANALNEFQAHFGISTSSAGFFGPLTRAFIGQRCGGQGRGMATSSRPMMWQGTSTPPVWNASSTLPNRPPGGWMGSSTYPTPFGQNGSSTPMRPCPQNASQGAAAVLFVPHVILPAFMMNPCGGPPQGPPQVSQ